MEGRSVCLISTVPCYPSVHGCVHVGSGRPLISQVNKKRGCEAFLAFVYELKAHRCVLAIVHLLQWEVTKALAPVMTFIQLL
uniref:Uncharacterized protein n=1 Tax=Oryzias melastigma TaxID=30732 RepID=A0A3B3B637_ORYME